MSERLRKHNEKWLRRYHVRAELRRRYPDEFLAIRRDNPSYHVALRLLEEAHPGEVEVEKPQPVRSSGVIQCRACSEPLRDHPLSGKCRT